MHFVLALLLVLAAALPAAAVTFENKQIEAQVESLFALGRDLASVKLSVDQMAGGSTAAAKATLDGMIAELKMLASGAETSDAKLKALKQYIYEPGVWTGNKPFHYDQTDPLGDNPANRYLARYLQTRTGNCVTMPMLFVILGRSIGLDLTFAHAPLHVLVKYTDDAGAVWNLEPTSGGGFTRDEKYRRDLPMSDEAIAKGTYLQPLSEMENVAVIASFLVEHYMATGRYEEAIVAADVILRHAPDDVYVILKRGSAFYLLLKRDILSHYKLAADMPPDVHGMANMIYQENLAAFAKAESLGWRETDGQKPKLTESVKQ